MQGRDVSSLYLRSNDENFEWRKEWFYEYNRGDPITAEGHMGKGWIDASFALITPECKYIYWPQHDYEQIFHRRKDPFEEKDLLHSSRMTPPDEIHIMLRARYESLKRWVQRGKPVKILYVVAKHYFSAKSLTC